MSDVTVVNFSGPYGAGKDTILTAVARCLTDSSDFHGGVHRPRTVTTRHSSGDADPTYHFVDGPTFLRCITNGFWIANAQLDGAVFYATCVDEIVEAKQRGLLCLVSLFPGPNGAELLRRILGNKLLSFAILATGEDLNEEIAELERRLRSRSRETQSQVLDRLERQLETVGYLSTNPVVDTPDGPMSVFDDTIVNTDLAAATEVAVSLITARRDPTKASDESDAAILTRRNRMPDIGGSYLEVVEGKSSPGRLLLSSENLPLTGSILPVNSRFPETSYYLDSLYRYLTRLTREDERLFGVYLSARGYLVYPQIYSVERLADFETEVGRSLERKAFVAVPLSDVEGRITP